MSAMHLSRRIAMQALFLWDAQGQQDDSLTLTMMQESSDDVAIRTRATQMATAAWQQRETIDLWLERVAPQWPPRRQPGVDRAILRLAVWELTSAPTPPKVVLDEAIELAKEFSTEQSPAFVNGVLDAVLREKDNLTKEPLSTEPLSTEPLNIEPISGDPSSGEQLTSDPLSSESPAAAPTSTPDPLA